MRKLYLVFLLFVATYAACTSQSYIPFPYKIEKDVTEDSAMVVTAHPLATKVGLDILRKGGNAIDATVAVQFALAVVYPQAGNIGGGGFLVYRDKKGTVSTLDYREVAPAAATKDMYLDSAKNVVPARSRMGALSCGVPGTVDGMWEAHKKYGRLKWIEVVQPAIDLAEKGFQITEQEAGNLNAEKFNFIKNSTFTPAFVKFTEWTPGDWLIQPDLAMTFKRIGGDGRAGFYSGAVPLLISMEMQKKGGIITEKDLADYHSVWRNALEFDYKDLHVITMAPPSSGGVILRQILGMLQNIPLKTQGFHAAAAVHAIVEAERRAYADRTEHLADPDHYKVPLKSLLSPEYIKERMANFRPDTVTPSRWKVKPGTPKESEQTTHFCIVDAEGNAASVTTTLNDSYGSRVVVGGAGFILNNEMDDFTAKPGAPNIYMSISGEANAIKPGKRPLSSMTPTIVLRGGKPWMVVGTPGGTTIPTSVLQTILNVYEFDLSLPDAVHKPRFHHQYLPDTIFTEENVFSDDVQMKLEKMGHKIQPRGPIGRVEAILRLPNGKWQGVADIRGDDAAGGY